MVYTISDNEFFSLICLQYGLPTLLFMIINIMCLHQFRYRMWRLQIWLHRLSSRFRWISSSSDDEDDQLHSKALALTADDPRQESPLIRMNIVPLLAFGMVVLMCVPFILLIAWGVIMWIIVHKMLVGIAIVLMGICLSSLYYAIQYWHSGNWRMTAHVQYLFLFSIGCYFLLAFVLSFLADGVTFFGQSVHFLTLNYMLITELLSQREKQNQIPAESLLKVEEYMNNDDAAQPVGMDHRRLNEADRKKLQKDQERKFFQDFKEEQHVLVDDNGVQQAVEVDEDIMKYDSDDDDDATKGGDGDNITLINIESHKAEVEFQDVLQSIIHDTKEATGDEETKYQVKLYLLSILVLLGYSFAIYKGNAPRNAADSETDSAQYLGFVVSGILVVWDALMWIYSTYSGRVLNDLTKIIILAGSRVVLIAFGFQGWFLGVAIMYGVAGVYLTYSIIDKRLPYATFQLNFESKRCQRFKEFALSLTNPDNSTNGGGVPQSSNALFATLTRGGSGNGMGVTEFIFIIMTVMYIMLLCVCYQTSPPSQSLTDFIDDDPWQQWELGLIAFYIVVMWTLSVWTIRYWMVHRWKISWQAAVLTTVMQAGYCLGAILLFYRMHSVILLVSLLCGPLFVLSLIGTYMHCVKVDWHLLAPSYMRNPPNLPFPLALISCGLQKDDYRMLLNIVLTCTMMVIIGLGITLGLNGSNIGWSITFVLFILVTSLIPLIKYLKTLTVDTIDGILIFLSFAAHITFFSLLYSVSDNMSDMDSFAFWGSCVGYPTLLANVLSYHLFRENGRSMTKGVVQVLMFTIMLIIICIIIIFFTLGATIGGVVLTLVTLAFTLLFIFIRWSQGNYTLPRWLRIISALVFLAVLSAGIAIGISVDGDGAGFWYFTSSWFVFIVWIAVWGWGNKARLNQGDSNGTGAIFRYSDHIFPVYYYDRRNSANPVRPANFHMGLYCAAFGLFFVWCTACMVTARVNIGLGCSALAWVTFYTFVRNLTISSNKKLMAILPYIDQSAIARAKSMAREFQLTGLNIIFDEPATPLYTLKKWGTLLHSMMLFNLNPLQILKKKQSLLKYRLGLGRTHCFCSRLRTDLYDMDANFILLEQLNEWSFACSKIYFKISAHFYFLLLLNALSLVQAEESTMKAFTIWLRKEKLHPVTGEPVVLDPHISNHDMYENPQTKFTQAYILQLQSWKSEYLASLKQTQADNEANRLKEAEAEEERQRRIEKREAEREARQQQREEEARQREIEATAAGLPLPPLVIEDSDPVVAEFHRAIEHYKKTGEKYCDEEFPPTNESLYLLGERNLSRGTALNMTPIDDEWKRPEEILKLLKEENPSEPIDTTPKLFIDGFDLSDIVQGNIGDCYYLSAIGCLGIREMNNPQQQLLSDIFTMERPGAEYNECGAFLVRFYRSGKKVSILIDDRLPTSQGNFVFARSKMLNEMWLCLLEKAYAKLFTCQKSNAAYIETWHWEGYEAIEAGLISQALCDLSNGASQQIALKGPSGQLSVDPESLWIQLEDSFRSGYLIGAGSNTGSDTTEVQGIAQGHAYMVVKIFQDAAKTERLIQLQNPHGHGEWDGDWSDSSPKWTQWWRNTLQQNSEVDDGKFWMSFQDFLQSYQNIYICRLLPYRKSLESAWQGHTACGPTQPWNNPTFCVKSPKPCKIWIELEQTNRRGKKPKGDASKMSEAELMEAQSQASTNDYAFIQFFMVENGGKRVEKIVKEQVKGCANNFKMVNDRQISAEVFLDAPDTPFTIVCVNKVKGFETGLTLSIFSADDAVQFWMLPEEPPPA